MIKHLYMQQLPWVRAQTEHGATFLFRLHPKLPYLFCTFLKNISDSLLQIFWQEKKKKKNHSNICYTVVGEIPPLTFKKVRQVLGGENYHCFNLLGCKSPEFSCFFLNEN